MELANATDNDTAPITTLPYPRYFRLFDFFVSFFALVGTSLLLLAITAHRKRTKLPLTTAMALWLLLGADLLFLLLMLVVAGTKLCGVGSSPLASLLTKTLIFVSLTLQGFAQCVVSIVRVIAIVRPLKVKSIVTTRRMLVALLGLVLVVCSSQILLTYFRSSLFIRSFCAHDAGCEEAMAGVKYVLFMVNLAVFRCGLPLLLLLVCSVWIMVGVRASRKVFERRPSWQDDNSRRRHVRELRLGVVLVLIDVIFIISTVPYFFMYVVFRPPLSKGRLAAAKIFDYLLGVGPVTDWLVLLLLGEQMRAAVLTMLSECACRRRAVRSPPTTSGTETEHVRSRETTM